MLQKLVLVMKGQFKDKNMNCDELMQLNVGIQETINVSCSGRIEAYSLQLNALRYRTTASAAHPHKRVETGIAAEVTLLL